MPLRYIDDYSVEQVVRALRRITLSPKARTLVTALATAPNRAMSRYELARAIGSENAQACNGTYGYFLKNLALQLDPTLEAEWKPSTGPQSDWVMFANHGPARWTTPLRGEVNSWVFVMRETLARALERTGLAPYTALDVEGEAALERERLEREGNRDSDDDREDTTYNPFTLDDPIAEIDDADEELQELADTEREAIIRARIGQGVFRERVVEQWGGCCAVTGADFLPALVASHIIPWSDCTNDDRLNPGNGLLLVGTLDRLFDERFVSFDANGQIVISSLVPPESYAALGLH